MLPYVEIFGRVLPSYGLAAAAGVLLAVLYVKLSEPGRGSVSADLELASVWGALGCFLGAKALYLLTALPQIAADWPLLRAEPTLFIRAYLAGGFVFYGGLYGALAAIWLYCRAARADADTVFRRVLPALPLIPGCCYGVECPSLGLAFTASEAAPNGVKLLPVQLIEAALVLALFAPLARMSARGESARRMLGVYLAAYSAARFVLEFFRGDALRGFVAGLSVSQLIAIMSLAFAAHLLLGGKGRGKACHQ